LSQKLGRTSVQNWGEEVAPDFNSRLEEIEATADEEISPCSHGSSEDNRIFPISYLPQRSKHYPMA